MIPPLVNNHQASALNLDIHIRGWRDTSHFMWYIHVHVHIYYSYDGKQVTKIREQFTSQGMKQNCVQVVDQCLVKETITVEYGIYHHLSKCPPPTFSVLNWGMKLITLAQHNDIYHPCFLVGVAWKLALIWILLSTVCCLHQHQQSQLAYPTKRGSMHHKMSMTSGHDSSLITWEVLLTRT